MYIHVPFGHAVSIKKQHFRTSSVISYQASMYMCSLVSVFCSRLFSVKQLTFEIYIILYQYSYRAVLFRVLKIKPDLVKSHLDCNFLSSSYGNESQKSVGYVIVIHGDNPRALASGLSCVQVAKHGITILYHLHQCRPCTS